MKTNFYPRIPLILDPGKKIPQKIVRKIKKLKNLFPALFLAKTGQERPKKWKQKFYSRIPFIVDQRKKISKKIVKNSKNYKTSSRHYFYPKRDEISQKSENKILLQNSVHIRPGQKNSEKNSKKIEKIIKPLPGIIFSPNWMR